MQKFLIVGGNRLKGTIRASGSKNATLPVLAACILNASRNIIHEVPKLKDVLVMKDVLTHLGAGVTCRGSTLIVDSSNIQSVEISEDLMRRMRASKSCSGRHAHRFGRVKISYPGGCQIGSRPMDLHFKGLQSMGTVIKKSTVTYRPGQKLTGADIHLDLLAWGRQKT